MKLELCDIPEVKEIPKWVSFAQTLSVRWILLQPLPQLEGSPRNNQAMEPLSLPHLPACGNFPILDIFLHLLFTKIQLVLKTL